LDAAETITLLHDLKELANAGDIRESAALTAAGTFAKSTERQIGAEARSILADASDLVQPPQRGQYQAFVRRVFGAEAAALGWATRADDDADTRLLRGAVLPFVAIEGNDEHLQAAARRLTDTWLDTHTGLDADMLSAALSAAAYAGDQRLFDRLVAELRHNTDRNRRRAVVAALGSFRDPEIVRQTLALPLNSEFDARETIRLIFTGIDKPETRTLAFDFVKARYDDVLKRFPRAGDDDAAASLIFVGRSFCDEPSRLALAAFFEPKIRGLLGGPRNYEQVMESIRLCEARHAAQADDVKQFLERQPITPLGITY
jgi:alanyl aminopeptidase